MEEAFDLARDGRLEVTPELIDCGLKACDVIRLIIEEKAESSCVPEEAQVTTAFTKLLPGPDNPQAEPSEESKPGVEVRTAFEIIFKPKREMFYSGSDPVTLLDDLRALGQAHITAHADQVPLLASLEAEHCYLWWEILLVTDRDQAAVKEVFVFVEDECELSIRQREDQAAAVALLGSVPTEAFELFVAECEDLLEGIERDALLLETDPVSRDGLDSLFRSVHSIKGNAGLLMGQIGVNPKSETAS
jgi:two-component system chemotaxis sensor kinase CheA